MRPPYQGLHKSYEEIGAKSQIHAIGQMVARKQIVLIASSDLEELATVCDRVLVFVQGVVIGTLHAGELSERGLLEAIPFSVANPYWRCSGDGASGATGGGRVPAPSGG